MKAAARKGFKLPEGLKIGERFMLHFDAPDLVQEPQLGRLQDLSADGALCIDVPADLRPPRGTPVTISSLRRDPKDYRFSSEILGRGRLNGRLPVLLVKAPRDLEEQQRRGSYRVSVALKARAEWHPTDHPEKVVDRPAVVANLSGGGARLYLREAPDVDSLYLSIAVPDTFIEEWAMRRLARLGTRTLKPSTFSDPFQQTCSQLRTLFERIETRIIHSTRKHLDSGDSFETLSVAFGRSEEGCYRLVRYLERQAAQKGIEPVERLVATAA